MFECFHCGERAVIWDADFDLEDYEYYDFDGNLLSGIVHNLHCTNCGAEIEYIIPDRVDPDAG